MPIGSQCSSERRFTGTTYSDSHLAAGLPPGVTVKSISAPKGTSFSGTGASGTWTINSLKKKDSATLTVTLTVGSSTSPGANVISSTATAVFANQGLINTGNDSTTQTASVGASADVSVSKHSAPKSVQAGGNILYTVTVTNVGPSVARNVSFIDVFPVGATFVQQTQTSGPSFSLASAPGQVTNTLAILPPGVSASFCILVQIDGDLPKDQKLTNKVTIATSTNDPKASNNFSTATTSVTESGASLNISPTDPSKLDLVITGSSKSDSIVVQPAAGGKVSVLLNGKSIGSFNPSGNIVVYGRAGDDSVVINAQINRTAILFGGSGNDTLIAGAGNSVLSGGDGSDNLKSGSGRNILISGKGAGTLDGTLGANVLVGGYTAFDACELALSKLLSEWSRNDAADYLTRVNHLRGTTLGGNNLSFVLNTTTVSDNSAVDLLFGGASDDWYLAHIAGGPNDSVTGKSPSEELDTI